MNLITNTPYQIINTNFGVSYYICDILHSHILTNIYHYLSIVYLYFNK